MNISGSLLMIDALPIEEETSSGPSEQQLHLGFEKHSTPKNDDFE